MYYLVGAAGNIISRDLPEYNITQVTTGGSTENCKRLLKGELDMGIVYGPHVYMALHNQGPFKNDPTGTMLRGVAKAYEGASYAVTLPGFRYQNDERPDREKGCTRSSRAPEPSSTARTSCGHWGCSTRSNRP